MQRASIATILFLVLLRLAIGWHFMFEGLQKIQSVQVGQTVTNRPFSSAGYLREATGPLGGVMRWTLGDPDDLALSHLVVEPLPEGKEPSREPPHLRAPAGLARDWQSYLSRFEKHYEMNDQQREEARGKLEQAEDALVLWLLQDVPSEDTPEQKKSFPSGDVSRKVPTAERVQQYRDRLTEVREMLGRKMRLFGRDVEKARLRQVKSEASQLRTGLMRDLDKFTQSLTRSLDLVVAEPVLTPLEHLDNDLVRGNDLLKSAPKTGKTRQALETVVNGLQGLAEATRDLTPLPPEKIGTQSVTPLDCEALRKRLQERAEGLSKNASELKRHAENTELKQYAGEVDADARALTAGAAELPDVGGLPITVESSRAIDWIDWLTRWGLTVVGGCLLVGLFTRTNCWLAAGFLFMTYLAMPAFPWLPAPPQSEGNYLFVNKNVIEMLALCALGTMATGRWFGLDAILGWMGSVITGKRKA